MEIIGTKNDQQQTEAWKLERMGRFSCSQLHRLMTEPKDKTKLVSVGAETYIEECISEKLTGMPAKDPFTSKDMQWGIDNEPIAKKIYETVFECKVEDVSYIPYGENFGGSPDGLIGKDGGIEIKCPARPTHLRYLRMQTVEDIKKVCPEYYWQIIGYMIIAGRVWMDFVSYHPHFKARHQFKKIRVSENSDIDFAIKKINNAEIHLKQILNSL